MEKSYDGDPAFALMVRASTFIKARVDMSVCRSRQAGGKTAIRLQAKRLVVEEGGGGWKARRVDAFQLPILSFSRKKINHNSGGR